MVKHIYSGKIPEDPAVLSEDLLKLADMYQLDTLRRECISNMIEDLDVENCVSTFVMIDRLLPEDAEERNTVISFMICNVSC